MKDIFERDLAGEAISICDPEAYKINQVIENTQKILALSCWHRFIPISEEILWLEKTCLSIRTVPLWTGAE